jgi:DNA polymerase IV
MTSLHPPTSLRWLFLDLNSYFASVEQNEDQRLRGRPVAVLPLMSDSTCCIAASYEAKAYGIKTGTPVWQAKQLCPDIILISGKHDLYVRYHHRIIAEIERHIPVTEVCSIDEMACRLDLREQDPAIARDLAMRIKRGLRERVGPAIRCSIGLAPSRLLAKIGTNLQKPDGLVILAPQDLPGPLLKLALTDLPGISDGNAIRLARGGITTLEAFWHLDPCHARRLLGSVSGERYWYALHGYDFPEFRSTRNSVSHSQVLAPEVRVWSEARLVGRRLAQKAGSRLRRLGLVASGFGLSLRSLNREGWSADCELVAGNDTFLILSAFEQLWEQAGGQLGQPMLRKVGVWLTNVQTPDTVQADLFSTHNPQIQRNLIRRARLSACLDELNKKYGQNTVLVGVPARKLAHYTGTKVAFTRIPDLAEFYE